jgi:OOP family OmpA-OmpF porin
VRSRIIRTLLLLTLLAIVRPIFAWAEHPESNAPTVWLVPGAGAVWPPAEWGVKDPAVTFGGILGLKLSDPIAFELRGHYASSDSTQPYAHGDNLKLLHGEGNVTWFLAPFSKVAPYLTGGVGAVRGKIGDFEKSEFAFNFGAGFRIALNDRLAIRLDARDMRYKVAVDDGEDKTRNSIDTFGGLSFGFGGKPADSDHDGVPDKNDKCPGTPVGAVVDANGCPKDSDGDGVYDGLDLCPGTPKGATVDEHGCPKDSDGDGVFDGMDKCPDTPAGAKVDATGCPIDSDGDGVPDGIDKCDNTPRGCTVNANGCPTDSDQDGVCDGLDQCPDTQPGVRVDEHGCPLRVSVKETELLETGMIRLQDIEFDTGKSTIQPESYPALDDVGSILVKWPQLRIEIGGHTDSRGSVALNQKLSEARAKAVLDYLTNKFPELNVGQFTTAGYGESKPIASNTTTLGRAKNRRVEFKVLNKEALKKETEKQQFVPKE